VGQEVSVEDYVNVRVPLAGRCGALDLKEPYTAPNGFFEPFRTPEILKVLVYGFDLLGKRGVAVAECQGQQLWAVKRFKILLQAGGYVV
jgi:hypothetical protein